MIHFRVIGNPPSEEGEDGCVGCAGRLRFRRRPRAESSGLRATGATRSHVPMDSMIRMGVFYLYPGV